MKLQVTAPSYHLHYHADDDRLVISVDVMAGLQLAMPLTRRLTRNLLAALARLIAERSAAVANPVLRDSMLDFEHGASVATAVASGTMRNEGPEEQSAKQSGKPSEKPPALALRLVREVQLVPKPDGGITVVFDNGEQLLGIDVARDRLHMVIATFIQMADRAGWDFPPLASWLEGSKDAVQRSVN